MHKEHIPIMRKKWFMILCSARRISNSQKGQNLVLDATFHEKETRDTFIKQLSDHGEIFYIGLHSIESTIKERLKKSRPYSEVILKCIN